MRRVLPLLVLMAGVASADEVQLRSGRKITNCIAKQTGEKVNVEVGLGSMVLDSKDVESILEGECALKEYPAKRAAIDRSTKASDWYGLADWCKTNGVGKHVRPLMTRVIELEPNHEMARQELGYSRQGGKWMTQDEANRERGLVQFEGRWVSPIEVELVKRKRLMEIERKMQIADEREKRAHAEAEARAEAQEAWAEQLAEMQRQQEFQNYVRRNGHRNRFGPMQPWSPWAVDTFDVVGFLQSKGFLPK